MKSIKEYESGSANPKKSIDIYEPEPREESAKTSKPEPRPGGKRQPLRERRAPTTYASQYILLIDEGEPECYEEAITNEHKEKWLSAMQDEMDSLHENYTDDLVELLKGKRSLRNKWVYKVKSKTHPHINSFAKKDLGPAKQMLRMHIVQDRTKKVLWLSQEKYVTKSLDDHLDHNPTNPLDNIIYCIRSWNQEPLQLHIQDH